MQSNIHGLHTCLRFFINSKYFSQVFSYALYGGKTQICPDTSVYRLFSSSARLILFGSDGIFSLEVILRRYKAIPSVSD